MNDTNNNTAQSGFTSFHRIMCFAGGLLLIGNGLKKGSIVKTFTGGYLAYKGFAGNRSFKQVCDSVNHVTSGRAINIRTSMVINKPRHEVYSAWRNLSNLPLFMHHLLKVEKGEGNLTHWQMQLPAVPAPIQWKAEIVKERDQELLAWQSVEDTVLQNAGKVEFSDALGKKGTAVDIVFSYHAPLGVAGEKVARLFTPVFKNMIRSDIKNFKDFVETGKSLVGKIVAIP